MTTQKDKNQYSKILTGSVTIEEWLALEKVGLKATQILKDRARLVMMDGDLKSKLSEMQKRLSELDSERHALISEITRIKTYLKAQEDVKRSTASKELAPAFVLRLGIRTVFEEQKHPSTLRKEQLRHELQFEQKQMPVLTIMDIWNATDILRGKKKEPVLMPEPDRFRKEWSLKVDPKFWDDLPFLSDNERLRYLQENYKPEFERKFNFERAIKLMSESDIVELSEKQAEIQINKDQLKANAESEWRDK